MTMIPMGFMRYDVVTGEDHLRHLLTHPDWVSEQKMDGTHVLAIVEAGGVSYKSGDGRSQLKHTAVTQHLHKVTPVLQEMAHAAQSETMVLDGEMMIEDGQFRLFDLPFMDGPFSISPQDPWKKRRDWLTTIASGDDQVIPVHAAEGLQEKIDLLDRVIDQGAEGVMYKHKGNVYLPGVRTDKVVKYKLVKTADVIVTDVNKPDPQHGSAGLAVYGPGGQLVDVGRCSLIGKPHVEPGDVIEIRYLYWTGQRVYQPRMDRVRTDKSPMKCGLGQFRAYSRAVV